MTITPRPAVVGHSLGLDLGQSLDYSALVLDELVEPEPGADLVHHIRHLHRWPLGTSYVQIVAEVEGLVVTPPLAGPLLAVDKTGVGQAVVEMFADVRESAQLWPILITSGHSVTFAPDGYHVAKIQLVSVLQACLSSGRLKIAAELPLADVLRRELLSFRVKITAAGNESFESWREESHDDLVLGLALAVWLGEHHRPPTALPPMLLGRAHPVRWPD
jgi:hypothetical protein